MLKIHRNEDITPWNSHNNNLLHKAKRWKLHYWGWRKSSCSHDCGYNWVGCAVKVQKRTHHAFHWTVRFNLISVKARVTRGCSLAQLSLYCAVRFILVVYPLKNTPDDTCSWGNWRLWKMPCGNGAAYAHVISLRNIFCVKAHEKMCQKGLKLVCVNTCYGFHPFIYSSQTLTYSASFTQASKYQHQRSSAKKASHYARWVLAY